MTHTTHITPEDRAALDVLGYTSWEQAEAAHIRMFAPRPRWTDGPWERVEARFAAASDEWTRPPGRTSSRRGLSAMWDNHRAKAIILKSEADLEGKRPPSTALCGTPLHSGDVEVWRSASGHAGLSGVALCHNAWLCSVCAPRRRALALAEGQKLIALNIARGGGFGYLTLTAAHSAGNDCLDYARRFCAAVRALRATPEWRRMAAEHGLVGAGGSHHFSWSHHGGFGWHRHDLLMFCAPVSDEAMALVEEALRTAWARCLRKRGLRCSHARGLKLEVPENPVRGLLYILRNPGLDDLLAGNPDPDPGQPKTAWGLLATATAAIHAGRWRDALTEIDAWADFAATVSALRLAYVRWTPLLAERLEGPQPEPEPEPELADDPCDGWNVAGDTTAPATTHDDGPYDPWPEPRLSIMVNRRDWLALILRRRAVPAVLAAMSEGGPPAVRALVERLRPPPDPPDPHPRPPPQQRAAACYLAVQAFSPEEM